MKRILYLGTSPTYYPADGHLIHYPVIKVVPRPHEHPEIQRALAELPHYTHLIFTSKNTVQIFFQSPREVKNKCIVAIGKVTAEHLKIKGAQADFVSPEETQEGVIELLRTCNLENSYLFLPRSSLARPQLIQFFQEKGLRYVACDLYDTVFQKPLPVPDLREIDEIVFTSPSTVDAFLKIFPSIPRDKSIVAIGPLTRKKLTTPI